MQKTTLASGFRFFFKGLKNSKDEIWVSIQLIVILTIFFSVILYVAEHIAQPDVYANFWESLLWSFTSYLEDPPEHVLVHNPISMVGKIAWAFISILKIALFAVPAGLVASGFSDAVAKEEEEKKLYDASVAIRKTFNRMLQSTSSYKFVPRYRSLSYLQVKTGLNVNDIVDAVNYSPDLRLVNLSATVPANKQNDTLAVAHMPINTEYGCFINRDSNVTIISTSDIVGPSNFAFSMAAMGCFNFVSKELSPSQLDALNFYLLSGDTLENVEDPENLDAFLDEIYGSAPLPISVKTRLGLTDPQEFPRILEVFNRYPIKELTVHPRVRKQFYDGDVDMDMFRYAMENSKNKLVFNGNLRNLSEVKAFEKEFPQIEAVMIGRGLIGNPAMLEPGGEKKLKAFHDELLETYIVEFGGARNAMFRMKENWRHMICMFDGSEKLWKKLRKCTDVNEYRSIVGEIFGTLPMYGELHADW